MAGSETRLLILGAVALFEPVNGYQIRRELLSWRVEEWAHINPGSIYSSLATMAKHGLLERHDLVDGGRDVAVYTLTAAGRVELATLFRESIESVSTFDRLAFHTALSMEPLVPRADFARWLAVRLDRLDRLVAELDRDVETGRATDEVPPHVVRTLTLWQECARVERRWVADLHASVEAGELTFAGEEMAWQPLPDDPGHQMVADRQRYLAMLGRA